MNTIIEFPVEKEKEANLQFLNVRNSIKSIISNPHIQLDEQFSAMLTAIHDTIYSFQCQNKEEST